MGEVGNVISGGQSEEGRAEAGLRWEGSTWEGSPVPSALPAPCHWQWKVPGATRGCASPATANVPDWGHRALPSSGTTETGANPVQGWGKTPSVLLGWAAGTERHHQGVPGFLPRALGCG